MYLGNITDHILSYKIHTDRSIQQVQISLPPGVETLDFCYFYWTGIEWMHLISI